MGGWDLRAIPLQQLNQKVAYVSQDNYLFDRTVRENPPSQGESGSVFPVPARC